MQYALSSRVVIEQAKGILAHYGRLAMDHAFTALRGHARRHRLPLTDLAQALVNRQHQPADILRIPAPAHPTNIATTTTITTGRRRRAVDPRPVQDA